MFPTLGLLHLPKTRSLSLARASERPTVDASRACFGRPAVVSAQARDTIAYAGRSRRLVVLH